jgi:hypothetical protein
MRCGLAPAMAIVVVVEAPVVMVIAIEARAVVRVAVVGWRGDDDAWCRGKEARTANTYEDALCLGRRSCGEDCTSKRHACYCADCGGLEGGKFRRKVLHGDASCMGAWCRRALR